MLSNPVGWLVFCFCFFFCFEILAITVSQRVAAEMGVDVGDKCGYAIRFEDKTSKNTEIKFMTDGTK